MECFTLIHILCHPARMLYSGARGDSFTGVRYFTSMPPTSYELRRPANSVANSIQFERYRMKRKLVTSFGLAVGLLMICAPVFAHHGGSDYDTQNLLTLKGNGTQFFWENPHFQEFFIVKKDYLDKPGHLG